MLSFLQTTEWRAIGGPYSAETPVTWLPGQRVKIGTNVLRMEVVGDRLQLTQANGVRFTTLAWVKEKVAFWGRCPGGWLLFFAPKYPAPLIQWLSDKRPFVATSFGEVSGSVPDSPNPILLTVDPHDGPFLIDRVKVLSHKERTRVALDSTYSTEFVDTVTDAGVEGLYTPCSLHYQVCVIMCAERLMRTAQTLRILSHAGPQLKVTTETWKNFPELWAFCLRHMKGTVDWQSTLTKINADKSFDNLGGISSRGLFLTFGCANIVTDELPAS